MKIPFLQTGPQKPARMISASILRSTFERRSVVIGAVQGGIGALLALRLGYLAVAENEKYRLESESNRVNLSLIPPRRGWIVDRNGKALANNRVSLRIDLIPDRLHSKEMVLGQLRTLLRLDGMGKGGRRYILAEAAPGTYVLHTMAAFTWASSRRSAAKVKVSGSPSSSFTWSSFAWVRPIRARRAPSDFSSLAVQRPSPEPPPVTTMVRPANRPGRKTES